MDKVFSYQSAKHYYKTRNFNIGEELTKQRIEAVSSERDLAVSMGAENTDGLVRVS
jgi:hypothetical protein